MKTTKEALREAIEDLSGRKVGNIDIYLDPKVPGTMAIRAECTDPGSEETSWDKHLFFLYTPGADAAPVNRLPLKQIQDDLAEAQFTSWPPTSR